MRLFRIVVLGTLASMMALGIAPLALATSADAQIMYAPTSCAPPGCIGFTVTFSVTQNDQCPSGGSVTGTVTESGPLGSNSFTVTNPSDPSQPLPCGTPLTQSLGVHPVYPQTACDIPFAGTYSFEFSGSTQDAAGAPISGSSFDVKSTYVIPPCASVPQFPLGMAMLFALTIPLLLALRRRGPAFRAHMI